MRIIDTNEAYYDISKGRPLGNISFESNLFIVNKLIYKMFKIEGTKFNRRPNYLHGKYNKAFELERYFSAVKNVVSPVGVISDDKYIAKGLIYPYIYPSTSLYRTILESPLFKDKVHLMKKASKLLSCIHKKGCIHADPTSNNIVINSKGILFFVDMDNAMTESTVADCRNSYCENLLSMCGFSNIISRDYDKLIQLTHFTDFIFGKNFFYKDKCLDKLKSIQENKEIDSTIIYYFERIYNILHSEFSDNIPYFFEI